MQISAANLLATQSQASVRTREAAPAFEPIAFKQTPANAATQQNPQAAAAPGTSNAPAVAPPATATSPGSGYVRPGTNLDIKI